MFFISTRVSNHEIILSSKSILIPIAFRKSLPIIISYGQLGESKTCATTPLMWRWLINSGNWMSLTKTISLELGVPCVVVWTVLYGVVVVWVPNGRGFLLKRHPVLPESSKQINGRPHNCPLTAFAFNKTIGAKSVRRVRFGVELQTYDLFLPAMV